MREPRRGPQERGPGEGARRESPGERAQERGPGEGAQLKVGSVWSSAPLRTGFSPTTVCLKQANARLAGLRTAARASSVRAHFRHTGASPDSTVWICTDGGWQRLGGGCPGSNIMLFAGQAISSCPKLSSFQSESRAGMGRKGKKTLAIWEHFELA